MVRCWWAALHPPPPKFVLVPDCRKGLTPDMTPEEWVGSQRQVDFRRGSGVQSPLQLFRRIIMVQSVGGPPPHQVLPV